MSLLADLEAVRADRDVAVRAAGREVAEVHREALREQRPRADAPQPRRHLSRCGLGLAKLRKISKFLQIFGGLVLGCIKTKFCKKICV